MKLDKTQLKRLVDIEEIIPVVQTDLNGENYFGNMWVFKDEYDDLYYIRKSEDCYELELINKEKKEGATQPHL